MAIDDAYYEGDQNLQFATAQFREAFGALFAAEADNWMRIVVDAAVERLHVQGFRFGRQQSADEQAWEIWQANGLDAQAMLVHTEAVKLGESYWLVEPGPSRDDPPTITGEHPMQVIVAHSPGNRRVRLAALKKWLDEDGFAYANVYLPAWVAKYRSAEPLSSRGARTGGRINWTPIEGGVNPLGAVPVVTVPNLPTMMGGGQSDIAPVRSDQNAINKLRADMLIGSEYQSFPQRVLLGVEVPRDANGQPIRAAQLQASKSRLWAFSSPDAKIAEFSAADLGHYVKAREHLIRGFTAKTRVPPYYVNGEIVNASGDALQIADNNLVAKVRLKMPFLDDAHEDMMRLAFRAIGNTDKAAETTAEVVWKDPETRSFAALVDGAVKLKELGIHQELLQERIGMSPQEIARNKALGMVDDILTPTPAPAPGPAPEGVADAA